jgi:pyruvate kinase
MHSLGINRTIACCMSLAWGARPIVTHEPRDIADVTANASRIPLDEGLAQKGDVIAITAGMPFGVAGRNRLLSDDLGDAALADGEREEHKDV